VGIDTTLGDGIGPVVIFGSIGQTFKTQDTLVTSLTVWRLPWGLYHLLRPRIVDTDSTGKPIATTVWEGPALSLGDDPSGRTPYTWTFDPPLVLPHRGSFAWYVCSGDINMLAALTDPYPDGNAWRECRGVCGPGCRNAQSYDLVFNITFCSDRATAARRQTWGQLKTIYR
jgi:hypothetical protein